MRFETSNQGSKNRIFTPFGDFYIDVENLFEQVLGNKPASKHSGKKSEGAHDSATNSCSPSFQPPAQIIESESAFHVSLDLPGVDTASVTIELLDGQLMVSGDRAVAEVPEGARVLQDGRKHGDFARAFRFDVQVDEDKIEAAYENGVLTVVVPKAAKPVARKIEIKTGTTDA